jgi:hypothetical protein
LIKKILGMGSGEPPLTKRPFRNSGKWLRGGFDRWVATFKRQISPRLDFRRTDEGGSSPGFETDPKAAGQLQFNDMKVMGAPSLKLRNALEIIANHLHQEFAIAQWISDKDKSKESCVLCSLTVREFLVRIGFKDAHVRPVCLFLSGHKDGRTKKILKVGDPDDKRCLPSRWSGHMVVVIPSAAYMIDTTLYQANRPEWKSLSGMAAVPLGAANGSPLSVKEIQGVSEAEDGALFPLKAISGVSWAEDDSYGVTALWLDNPTNKSWRGGRDARMKNLRIPVVNKMIRAWTH